MMHSVLMVAALLAAASKGLETTYTAEFVSPQAFAQGSVYLNESIVSGLESSGVTIVSTSFDGTKYSFTVEEETAGSIGSTLCFQFQIRITVMKEICFINGISMGETAVCTISSFDNYAAQCTSNVSSRYYLESPLAATIDKNEIDALILGLYSGTLVRYVSSDMNYTHYTIDVTESHKGEFAEMFCYGASSFTEPGEICYVASVSDSDNEYCRPYEGEACQPITVEYKIMYPALLASQFNKDTLDAHMNAVLAQVVQVDLNAAFVSSSNDQLTGTYTVSINETTSGTFGGALEEAISGSVNLKCTINKVSEGDNVYYTTPAECFVDVVYNIQFLRVAASQIDPDNVTAQIQGMCQMVSAQGLKTEFVNSSYDISSAIYTFTVKEQVVGVAGNATAKAIKGDATLKCAVESLYSGEVVYFAYTEDECLVDVTYSIQFLSVIAPKINPDNITAQIQTLCQAASAQGFKTEFVSKSYDVSTANYTFTVKETFPGAFGNATAKAIKNTELKCLVKKISGNNDVEYLTFNEDECYFTTVYKFGLSMNTPNTINKEFIDGLLDNFVDGETLVYVESNFTSSLYTVTIKELQEGSVSDTVCSMLPGFVSMKGELCYVTFVKYGDNEAECTPRVDDYCAKINPGVTTLYEVKYYGNMSTKEELDAFFEAACKYARDASGENVKLVSSTYSKKNYKPTIVEPVTGIFGSHFCRYINDDYKCDFGSLKSGGNDYCKNPECKSAAFGFAPLAFLMALIFAFFF